MVFGMMRLASGDPNNDDKFDWTPGLPAKQKLPSNVVEYLNKVLYPHFNNLLQNEQNKEVIEKVLECIRDLADFLGPAAFAVKDLESFGSHL
jgi:hypothetical protein